jgi:hypothetical protein
MNTIKWSILIVFTGLFFGIFAPFPLILVPVLLGGLVTYVTATNQLTNRFARLFGLGSVYISIFAMFLTAMTAIGPELNQSNAGSTTGKSSDHALYLMFAFVETIFYILTLVVLKMMLPTFYDSKAELHIHTNQKAGPVQVFD